MKNILNGWWKQIKQRTAVCFALAALALMCASNAQAYTWGPLGNNEAAQLGANYVFEFSHGDLTNAVTNSAQTISVNVASNSGVELVAFILDEAATTGTTNYTGSTALKVGDGDDDDRYLASTEMNVDGTEVWFKFPPANAGTVTMTFQTLALTGTVQNVAVVTNGTASFTASALGKRAYTADDTVDFVFTPNAEESLSQLTALRGRAYFRITSR